MHRVFVNARKSGFGEGYEIGFRGGFQGLVFGNMPKNGFSYIPPDEKVAQVQGKSTSGVEAAK
jgi:hypothetical protein